MHTFHVDLFGFYAGYANATRCSLPEYIPDPNPNDGAGLRRNAVLLLQFTSHKGLFWRCADRSWVADLRTIPNTSSLVKDTTTDSSGSSVSSGDTQSVVEESPLVKVFPMTKSSFLRALVDATRALNVAYERVVHLSVDPPVIISSS